jgi:glutamine synthetase
VEGKVDSVLDARGALRLLEEHSVEWVDLQFLDLVGYLRHVTLHKSKIDEDAFKRGLGKLDGSSVKGFTAIEESDLVLKPVPRTLSLIPAEWMGGSRVARFLCEVYEPGGTKRLERDPRYILEKAIDVAAKEGFNVLMSYELEFFVFKSVDVELDAYNHVFRI